MGLAWLDRKHARRGWFGFVIVAGAAIAFLALDFDFLSVTDEALVLQAPTWTLSSGDVPRTWTHFERSAAFQRITQAAPEAYSRFQLEMRRRTGIRWTPVRCNLWFGRIIYVFGDHGAVVASMRATLLTRAAYAVAQVTGLADTRDGVSQIGGLYVARTGNFLVAGTTSEIVSRLVNNGQHISSVGGHGILFGSSADPAMGIYASADGEITTSIWLNKIEHRAPDRAEYFSIDWPEAPIVSVVSRGMDIDSIVPKDDWPEFPGSQELARTWKDFEKLLPEGWRAGADTTQFALFDVDTSETIPVPDAAVYSRSETPLLPLQPPTNAIPYEWSGTAGWMTPWLGEGANLFVVADDRSRVFTNQEATMEKLMARRRAGRIASDDARIEIDTARLARVLTDLARRAAKDELVPERNAEDVEQEVIPWLRAFGALGEIRLEGKYENDGLTLRGGTHAPSTENAQ